MLALAPSDQVDRARWTRRELLVAGSVPLLGLSLPALLRRRAAAAAPAQPACGFGTADSVIFLYLQGAPSHIDLWDPKPEASIEIRGEFQPIATTAPGVFLGEVLPLLAQQADNFTVLRSLSTRPKGLPNHGSAIYMLLTGHDSSNFSPTGLAMPPSREDLPSIGATIARFRPAEAGRLSYAALCGPVKEGLVTGLAQRAGLLGPAYDPFEVYDDATQELRVQALALPPDVTLGRLQSRVDLRTSLQNAADPRSELDTYFEQAVSLMSSREALAAFELQSEATAQRERYGLTRFGQSCLLARRLVEAGTRFVQVNWPARSDDEPVPGADGSWDTHRNNFPMLRDHRCPVFDRAVSGLLEDLAQRGLLERTLVVAVGEFGRSPRIGQQTTNNVGPGGRDHWPYCYSCLVAGGGIAAGRFYGSSDANGAYPESRPTHPYELLATVHHALGISSDSEYKDTLARPRRLVQQGEPLLDLFG